MSGEEESWGRGAFPTTRWTMVQEAKAQDTAALSGLCEQYWFPLYGFARRLGYSVEDAKDLTQDFFHHFLANKLLDHTSPGKGRMRRASCSLRSATTPPRSGGARTARNAGAVSTRSRSTW